MREGKSRFNPCWFNKVIYVCGFGSSLIEGFLPEMNLFVSVKVRIPDPNACLLYVEDNALVVHSARRLIRFGVKEGATGRLKALEVPEKSWCTIQNTLNAPPIYDEENHVLYCVSQGICYSLSLDSRKQTSAAK